MLGELDDLISHLEALFPQVGGNHGLTAILPIVAVKDFVTTDRKTVLEAMALSHILTGYIKSYNFV